jgi:hypothetical protein
VTVSFYDDFVLRLARGQVDLLNADFRFALFEADYTFDATHENLGEILEGSFLVAQTASALVNSSLQSTSTGVALVADDPVFALVDAGSTVVQAVLYQVLGDEGADGYPLIAHFDGLGFPIETDGGNITFELADGVVLAIRKGGSSLELTESQLRAVAAQLTAALGVNSQKITGLSPGTEAGDAVEFSQLGSGDPEPIEGAAGVISFPAVTAGRRHAYVISLLVVGDDSNQYTATITATGDSTIGSFSWGSEPMIIESPEDTFGASPLPYSLTFGAAALVPRITIVPDDTDTVDVSACYAQVISHIEIEHTP